MYCQACGTRNSEDAELCRRCSQKLLVLSGPNLDPEESFSDNDDDFSLDEHLLERISVLEEAVRRSTESVEHLVSIVQKQERSLALAEAGLATFRELLERKRLVAHEEWEAVWERKRDFRLLALEKHSRFLRQRERMRALHRGERPEELARLLEEAEQALGSLDLDRAVTALEAAFRLDRSNHEVACFLGETLFNAGEPERALPFFDRLLELKPDHYEGLVYRGVIAHEAGDQEAARRLLERAARLFPDRFLPHFSLGAVCAAEGDLLGAIRHLGRAVAIDPVPQALYLLGRALHDKGRTTAAIRCLEETVRKSPGFEEAYHQLGLAYLDRRWHKKALETFREAQRLNPRKFRYHELVRYLSGGEEVPLPEVGGEAGALLAFGERALADGRVEEAHEAFRRALESVPDHPTLLTYYALACVGADRTEDIAPVVEKVAAENPGEMLLSTAFAAWMEALRGAGRFREGQRIGERLLSLGRSSFSQSIAYYEMAWNLAELEEDLDSALDFARRAVELAPDELSQYSLAALGWVHYKRQEYDQAVEYLSRSTQLLPSASTLTQLGMALLADGREAQAREVLARAGDLDGGRDGLELKVMECLRDSSRLYTRLREGRLKG